MDGKDARDRSLSISAEIESDLESHGGDGPAKPGRKKNPNSQAARRDQNRIAQREFRLRKQQRIRDLEARVEILSGGKDEALTELRNVLKDLMAENHTLRGMLRNLASFIGDGLGGVLPKLGWEQGEFDKFVNKGETDTAWEGYQRRKKAAQQAGADTPGTSAQGQKRPSEDNSSNRSKKARHEDADANRSQNGYSGLLSSIGNSSTPPAGLYSQDSTRAGLFSSLVRGSNNSPMYAQSSNASNSPLQYNGLQGGLENYQGNYLTGVNVPMNQGIAQPAYDSQQTPGSPKQKLPQQSAPISEQPEVEDDPCKDEAYKLIAYHLENYKRNSNYCLPASLRPTLVQRSVPHESAIDSILHPELRDRLILYRRQYDMVDFFIELQRSLTIHGDDVLTHTNWEIGESFFRKFPFLTAPETIAIANRWRKERGEPELRVEDYTTDQPLPT